MSIPLPSGILPVTVLSTLEVLYGDRVSAYRWEVLNHNTTTGVDTLAGYLDGVVEPSAQLKWQLYEAVKGTGSLRVNDLAAAQGGFLRIADVALARARLRPVLVIDGLPEIPLGVYLVSAAPESWSAAGRVYGVELLDRCTVLDQDEIEVSYTVASGTVILSAVATVIASAGEAITVDASVATALASTMVWPAGTSKLQIVNDLLATMNYASLWVDGVGNFRATPYVAPASRSINYELLNGVKRELVASEEKGIFAEEWTRDRDLFKVPNKVITVQSGSGAAEALTGLATNTVTDVTAPTYPFSYAARGNRWISKTIDGIDVPAGTTPEQQAYLNARARSSLIGLSSVQATIVVKHLPLPVRVSDVLQFAHVPSGIDARHVITSIDLDAYPLGLMSSTLQEVVDL
jgi:hypothetical protein